ncbi:hypothetical protein NLI96_g3416 [Meripilus lineatus]|uniref:Uncharacterized protein n=1 Tax=Meripilus lineatus TaxID=2056292 RepID=A0AAD5YKV4_9APHY|nr:hypothetical protein NLI96_g3416 [Physisporinus lineatus]
MAAGEFALNLRVTIPLIGAPILGKLPEESEDNETHHASVGTEDQVENSPTSNHPKSSSLHVFVGSEGDQNDETSRLNEEAESFIAPNGSVAEGGGSVVTEVERFCKQKETEYPDLVLTWTSHLPTLIRPGYTPGIPG